MSDIRLQKVLASAGLGSRRACEQLIEEGRVTIDGVRVVEQGRRVVPGRQEIRVDGELIPTTPGQVVMVLNKPRGVLSSMSDPKGRPCVGDLLPPESGRLFHVGRLDAETEGLLLVTNDGDLAQLVSHPSHGMVKTYLAVVEGRPSRGLAATLRKGVELDDGPVRFDSFRIVSRTPAQALVELSLHEGRNHVVRRTLAAVGLPVQSLARVAIGPITVGELKPGRWRHLSSREIGSLISSSV